MKNPRYTSIIITSFIPEKEKKLRADMFRTSLDSLLKTTEGRPVEIIIVDNGGDVSVSGYIDGLLLGGAVQVVIHNATNMHFGFARNQGIFTAAGEYIVVADNDILYQEGWLEACWKVLEAHPDKKLWATPIAYPDLPNGKTIHRYDMGELDVEGETYLLNMRAGSNCFMTRERDFASIGLFRHHRIAGSVWNDMAVKAGFLAAVSPTPLVSDMGLRVGYNHREPLPVFRVLRDGSKVYFNQDEYKIPND